MKPRGKMYLLIFATLYRSFYQNYPVFLKYYAVLWMHTEWKLYVDFDVDVVSPLQKQQHPGLAKSHPSQNSNTVIQNKF